MAASCIYLVDGERDDTRAFKGRHTIGGTPLAPLLDILVHHHAWAGGGCARQLATGVSASLCCLKPVVEMGVVTVEGSQAVQGFPGIDLTG